MVPFIDEILVKRCISSFHESLLYTNSKAVFIYNGNNPKLKSEYSNNNYIIIGNGDSIRISEAFAKSVGYPADFLFGNPTYFRSYGGASNLILAAGYSLDPLFIGKVDEDLIESKPKENSWLTQIYELPKDDNIIYYGDYLGNQTGFLLQLPLKTSYKLVEFLYSPEERYHRLHGVSSGRIIRNGNIVIPPKAIKEACYPILYNPIANIHVRGEIYFFIKSLREKGYSFNYDKELSLIHLPSKDKDLRTWLQAVVYGYDLSYLNRKKMDQGRLANRKERVQAITNFKSWIMSAEWPDQNFSFELAKLLDKNDILTFTDEILKQHSERIQIWNRLFQNDLHDEILRTIPELVQFISRD